MSNQYKYIRFLGKGAFGDVSLYTDQNGRDVVIKKMPIKTNNYELIKREIFILSKLDHPRIIRLISYFVTKSNHSINIVMEFARGGTLHSLIKTQFAKRKLLQQTQILSLFRDMLMGVQYLHMRNIIHRDLKPDNILLDLNLRVKIADFGISKIYANDLMMTTVGTPLYMAPEIFEYSSYDYKCDVWSLGVILYEMCTLKLPFTSQSRANLMRVILSGKFSPIDCKKSQYNHGFRELTEMMLITNPEKRSSLNAIICHPMIMKKYYEQFFNYDY